jgi:hypothetical protein
MKRRIRIATNGSGLDVMHYNSLGNRGKPLCGQPGKRNNTKDESNITCLLCKEILARCDAVCLEDDSVSARHVLNRSLADPNA